MWIKTLPRLCCHQWHLGSIILFLLLLANLHVPRVLLWVPWQCSRKTNIQKPQSDLRKHNAKWCKEDSGAGKILKKMGQIESQIFGSSYVAKVILGTISPVQPKSRCPKPRPPSYAGEVVFPVTSLTVFGGIFSAGWPLPKDASSRLPSSQYQASSIACRCCSKRWRVAGDNCWYSRPETSKLSIVTETKFCFCFGVLSGVACGIQ